MKYNSYTILILLFIILNLLFSSCQKDVVEAEQHEREHILYGNGYLNLRSGKYASSADSGQWDIYIDYQLLINGGDMTDQIVRTGNAKGVLLDISYEDITEIPDVQLKQDRSEGAGYALGLASGGLSWYYVERNLFIPYKNKTIFMQSADGRGFAKIQILGNYGAIYDTRAEAYETLYFLPVTGFTIRYQYIESGQRFQ